MFSSLTRWVSFTSSLVATSCLLFIQLGTKGVLVRTLLMARPAVCHHQEAGPMAAGPCPPTGPQKGAELMRTPYRLALWGSLGSCRLGVPPLTEGAAPPQPSKVISQLHGIYPRPSFRQLPLPPALALALKARHSTARDGTQSPVLPCGPQCSSSHPSSPWALVRNAESQAPTQSLLGHHMQFK